MSSAPTYRLPVTGDDEADQLLDRDGFALLLGMLLDQQIPIAWAFRGPARLRNRVGTAFSPAGLAATDPEVLVEHFCVKPALHRYPAVMARRTHELCEHLVAHHGGDAISLWDPPRPGAEVFQDLLGLPGFGEEKAQIFLALLAKRFDVLLAGWDTIAGPFADEQPRSVADIGSAEDFAAVKAWKKNQKQQGKSKAD